MDDPTGNAYGNENFKDMEEYMFFEAKNGNRSVVYYGETAYWYAATFVVFERTTSLINAG